MRSVVVWVCAATAIAGPGGCSGNKDAGDDSGGAPPSCDDLATSPLGQVDVNDWPAGLADVLTPFDNIAGRWEATSSCGSVVAVKFVTTTRESLDVVTTPWTPVPSLSCGCTADPSFGDDTKYNPVAFDPSFEFYVEVFDDPALDGRTIPSSGALFPPTAPFVFRGCGVDDVDPVLLSAYDQVSTVLRVLPSGEMTGSLVLTPKEGDPTVCELSDFTLVEAL